MAKVPAHSALFFGIYTRDGDGVPHPHDEALMRLNEISRAPLFGYSREQLGLGIIGGKMLSFSKLGTEGAAAAVEILGGTPPSEVAAPAAVAQTPTYDARQLAKWNIPESRLPVGSIILFGEPTLWEAHRRSVLFAVAVTVLQMILIFFASRRTAACEGF